jgi:hypothetical protein
MVLNFYLNIGSGDDVGLVVRLPLRLPPILPAPLECQPGEHYRLRGPDCADPDGRLAGAQRGVEQPCYDVHAPVLRTHIGV